MDRAVVEIPSFDRTFSESGLTLSRIGSGEIGGKASGLKLIHDRIVPALDTEKYPYVTVTVPTLTVIGTDVFRAFVERNDLDRFAHRDLPDDRVAHAFQRAELPAEVVGDLRAVIAHYHTPLAVRSSSLLEDALDHPFAGVYGTKMIPNNAIEEDARFRSLVEAVKFVYASCFFSDARAYFRAIHRDPTEEAMAVIIQEIIGFRSGDHFYPAVSGVGRSYNFYPTGGASTREGVVYLALGLGKTIVDGGLSWGFSPALPTAPPPFNDVGDLLKNTQRRFWAVNMGDPPVPDPIRETEFLVEEGLEIAERDGVLKHLVSTYDPASDRLYSGISGHGARALTFAPLLTSRWLPFADLFSELLDVSKDVVGSDVEIEFAMRLDPEDLLPARFGFLQVRPMKVGGEDVKVGEADLLGDDVVVASHRVLGNGQLTDVRDIVFVRPSGFDPTATLEIAVEIERVNRRLVDGGCPYVLIGFGRWGTSDERLGIPVAWSQISGARVIVEATSPEVNPDLSQGSHFFHNVLSFQVLCLAVEHNGPGTIDWDWLEAQPAEAESSRVRHIRLDRPLGVRVDGSNGRGVIIRHG